MTDRIDSLPVPATDSRYAAATFELFQSSTEELDDLAGHAKAPRTLSGYANDWSRFRAWAASKSINVPAVESGRVDFDGEAIPPAP